MRPTKEQTVSVLPMDSQGYNIKPGPQLTLPWWACLAGHYREKCVCHTRYLKTKKRTLNCCRPVSQMSVRANPFTLRSFKLKTFEAKRDRRSSKPELGRSEKVLLAGIVFYEACR